MLNVILGIFGRNDAPLYFTMKKKIPKKAPWGEEPGRDLGEDASICKSGSWTCLLSKISGLKGAKEEHACHRDLLSPFDAKCD